MATLSGTDDLSIDHGSFHDNPNESADNIVDRKRELKGIPGSFSSNLGRRKSPPRPLHNVTPTSDGGNRSVKSIVAWLESSSSHDSPSKRYANRERREFSICSSQLNSLDMGFDRQSSHNTIRTASNVEEYSLTLLKYREYFTAKPLMRCLDGEEGTGQGVGNDTSSSRGDGSSPEEDNETAFVQRDVEEVATF